MTEAHPRRDALLFVLALALCIALSGCGKKAWPEPSDSEYVFSFASAQGTLKNGCLFVDATLAGAWENASTIYLQYAPMDCPGCPFIPKHSIEFIPGQGTAVLVGGHLSLQACGLDAPEGYRWRLTAANRVGALRSVTSEVVNTN